MGRAGDRGRPDLSPVAGGPAGDGSHFARLVDEEGDFNPFTERGWATLARRFREVVGEARGLRVLDVGCGTGRSRQIYAERAGAYVGMDLSYLAVRLAGSRERGPWLCGDALRLPFPEASLDVVAFSSVLHHIPDRLAALAEARRVLRPGGRVFAFDPNLLHPAMWLIRYPKSPLYDPVGVSPDERPLLPGELRRDFWAAGLADVGQRCQSDLPYRRVAAARLDRMLPLYNFVDRVWERSGIGRWLGSFVVTWAAR